MTTQVKQNSKAPYQLLPSLTDEEYQALKADIAEHGVLVPVEKDERGNILDGHHRVWAWQELRAEGIRVPDYPVLFRSGMTEPEKRNHVRRLNLLRRHLTKEQLKEQRIAMRQDGMTYQSIADASGVSEFTVRQSVPRNNETQPEFVIGKDGKHYPAKKKPHQPKTVVAVDAKDEKRALSAIAQAQEALPDKVITRKRAERIGREQDNERRRQQLAESLHTSFSSIDIRDGDFASALSDIGSDSVDLICTDPPYSADHLANWNQLAEFASRVLKPGGWLVTYSGQAHFDKVIGLLASKLTYVWTIAQVNSDNHKNIIHNAKIYSQWKPILIFAKPPITPLGWVNDLINGGGKDKTWHDCQQSESEAIYCVKSFSLPGQLVVDPFLGSGTTAVASHKLGRQFIGCDIDPANVSKAVERINGEN